MAIARWDPFQETLSLRDAMNRLFEQSMVRPDSPGSASAAMPTDVYTEDDHYVIEIAAPGLNPDAVDVTVEGNQVCISGQYPAPSEDRRYLFRERPTGRFERRVVLPAELDAQKAEAHCEHGVVRLTVPRAESARARRIAVGSGSAQRQEHRATGGEARHQEQPADRPAQRQDLPPAAEPQM